jgi:hypothetical protein
MLHSALSTFSLMVMFSWHELAKVSLRRFYFEQHALYYNEETAKLHILVKDSEEYIQRFGLFHLLVAPIMVYFVPVAGYIWFFLIGNFEHTSGTLIGFIAGMISSIAADEYNRRDLRRTLSALQAVQSGDDPAP